MEGRGAGEGPTASAVVADLIDIARGEYGPAFAMPVPSLIARAGFLPGAPITYDQWLMLQHDNVVTGGDGLGLFGVPPTPLATVAPAWLVRYRRRGRFNRRAAETADLSA